VTPSDLLDHLRVDDLVAVDDEERRVDRIPGLEEGVAASELVGLFVVGDRQSAVLVADVRAHAVAGVADDQVDFTHPRVDEGVEDVLEDRPRAGRQHGLRPVCGERAKASPLAGREHHGGSRARVRPGGVP
jgi:hypothetical protein